MRVIICGGIWKHNFEEFIFADDKNRHSVYSSFTFNTQHRPLAEYEWRTFTLTWDSWTRRISLYNPNRLVLTYMDTEKYENSNTSYNMFIRSTSPMVSRFNFCEWIFFE